MTTPTQLSLKNLRDEGYLCEVVERWNAFAKRRKDLFDLIDILAIREGEILAVQTTSSSNVSARVKKIAEHPNTPVIRKAGIKIVVHGWKKAKVGYTLRVVDCS